MVFDAAPFHLSKLFQEADATKPEAHDYKYSSRKDAVSDPLLTHPLPRRVLEGRSLEPETAPSIIYDASLIFPRRI